MSRVEKLAIVGMSALLIMPVGASAYSTTAAVVVTFGGNNTIAQTGTADGGLNSPSQPYSANADLSWTPFGSSTLSSPLSNDTYISALGGYNGLNYYNSDFATTCATGYAVTGMYNCNKTTSPFNFRNTAEGDDGPVGQASGTLTVTDTTLTGILSILSTTDEATGASFVIDEDTGAKIYTPGLGTSGYNYRTGDGAPFANAWNGTTTAGTYQVNLTGTFTSSSWQITGGTARYTDSGFACAAGGSDQGTLCTTPGAGIAGSPDPTGSGLSWGWDLDGSGAGTAMSGIEVRDISGTTIQTVLSGVLANLTLDGAGNITTNSAEFRRAFSSVSCTDVADPSNDFKYLRASSTAVTCGTLTAGKLVFSGQAAVVPLPGGIWFMATATAALVGYGRRRRRSVAQAA